MPSFVDVSGLTGLCGEKARSRVPCEDDRLLLLPNDGGLQVTFRAQKVLGFFEGALQVRAGLDAAEPGASGNDGVGDGGRNDGEDDLGSRQRDGLDRPDQTSAGSDSIFAPPLRSIMTARGLCRPHGAAG